MSETGIGEVALASFAVRLIVATMALAIIMVALRVFNGANNRGIKAGDGFNAALVKIRANPQAAAIYYGLRFAGICWMYGAILS